MSDTSSRRLEAALQGLVANVVEALPVEASSIARQYFDLQAPEDLVGRDVADLTQLIRTHYALGHARAHGTANVLAQAPVKSRDGWYSPHTVVQVVTDDMPFLVDSVAAEISRAQRSIHLVIHPIYLVKRDASGAIIDVLKPEAEDSATDDYRAESWMCFEIDRETDESDLRTIEKDLARVLSDVKVAVQDWPSMKETALKASSELKTHDLDAVEFLDWLADDHFTFTGYDFVDAKGKVQSQSERGVLRNQSSLATFALDSKVQLTNITITKGNSRSTIHHPVFVDCIVVPALDSNGKLLGHHRFVGLYASSTYTQSVFAIPLISSKAKQVVEIFDLGTDSHSGKDLLQFLETYPRDQLFQIAPDELAEQARGVLQLQERRQVRLFARTEVLERFVSILVYFPRDRYNTEVRLRMENILLETYGAASVDFTSRLTESVLARLHFEVRMPDGMRVPKVEIDALEASLANAAKFWEDHFSDALVERLGEESALQLVRKWSGSFPESFKEYVTPHQAVTHLLTLEELENNSENSITVALNETDEINEGARRFTIYRVGSPVTLSSVLPMLHDLGTEVIDERAYQFERSDNKDLWIYDFGIGFDVSVIPNLDSLSDRFCEAFLDTWKGNVDSDGFNALVVHGGLTVRNVGIIRAYAAYLRQAGTPFSQGYLQQVLRSNVAIVSLLLSLFRTRFDPAFTGDRESAEREVVTKIDEALDAVASLDHDRIMRSSVALVRATIRTNAYQKLPDGTLNSVLVFKLNPHQVPDLPLPVPMFEVWVFSPRVEGIHLRFAQVARGGLRWSDRLEDFRTEVLGLVKAQMVKNTVIVPSGAKGGFVMKRGPEPSDRDAWLAEGVACYQMFIRGLLDITDNLVNGEVVHPLDVVRHDSDDPYLVVAADKGTATFSDIANAISLERNFWMGDAFASGGSIGYDHKAMGITARGAWESVKRHFLELSVDCQTQDFRAVGIGDMSGDVFGNGMLLSEHIHLVAAFDHRHVFLDPNPDVAASFKERTRLFALPRSSWEDYNPSLISKGGGVFPRSAKSIELTPQVKTALNIDESITSLTPNELISQILQAPVDLLWNGGIGTYIKSATETHAQVGDKANDGLRVNGNQIKAKVLGEGGNLGSTQLGRIEAARAGVKLNTDAIDNSAGVDTSDHEVNIKIMLNQVVASGTLSMESRNTLLAAMTDEVGQQVLRDNYLQNVILEQSRNNSAGMLRVHQRLMHALENQGLLNRSVEYLPSDSAIDALHLAGLGLTSPELSVLMAYAKIDLQKIEQNDALYDEDWCAELLEGYFPSALRDSYREAMMKHPLRREIIATVLANDIINHGGITFVYRCVEETGAHSSQVLRAYQVAREVFGFANLWQQIEDLDRVATTQLQVRLYLECRRLLDRATRWFLQSRGGRLDVTGEIERFRSHVLAVGPGIPDLLKGVERQRFDNHVASLVEDGAPVELARQIAALLDAFSLLDIVDIAVRHDVAVSQVSALYFGLSERFEVDRLLAHITALPRDDRWSSNARSALRSDLYSALAGLTSRVNESTSNTLRIEERISEWESKFAEGVGRTRATLNEIATSEQVDLATLSVALRAIRTLVGQGAQWS